MSSPTHDWTFGPPLVQGDWQVRLSTATDHAAILRLRAQAFRGDGAANDADRFDADCRHLWVGHAGQGPNATIRLRLHETARDLLQGYAAQSYDLCGFATDSALPVLELGRLSTAPDAGGDALRLLWAGVARVVLRTGATRLIGCTSFPTTDPAALTPALAQLAGHIGPVATRPRAKASEVLAISPNIETAKAGSIPPLLRAYLALGGWVSDHAVIDRDLGTAHVFTCVDIATLPAARKRILSALAAS